MNNVRQPSTRAWIFVLTSLASFMVALDALVVSTALGTIRADLGASIEQLEWTVNSYTLSFALDAGLPIVAPEIGAFRERLAGRPLTRLFPMTASVDEIIAEVEAVLAAPPLPSHVSWPGQAESGTYYPDDYLTSFGVARRAESDPEAAMALALGQLDPSSEQLRPRGAERIAILLTRVARLPGLRGIAKRVPGTARRRLRQWLTAGNR